MNDFLPRLPPFLPDSEDVEDRDESLLLALLLNDDAELEPAGGGEKKAMLVGSVGMVSYAQMFNLPRLDD